MSNKFNKSILLSLGMLAILVLGFAMPNRANAQYAVVRPYNAPVIDAQGNVYSTSLPPTNYQGQNNVYTNTNNYYAQNAQNAPAAVVYANPTNTTPTTKVVYRTVYVPSTASSTNTTTNSTNSTNTTTDANGNQVSYTDKYNSLAASAILGGNTFAPSGLVQWVLLAILILIIIIIARRIFGATDRYHKSPLKHA